MLELSSENMSETVVYLSKMQNSELSHQLLLNLTTRGECHHQSTADDDFNHQQLYINLNTFWYCFLALITTIGLLVSLVSNMIIIYLFTSSQSLRTNPSNIIAVNLSLSDLLYCIQWPSVIYCSLTQSTWILEHKFVCQTFGFITASTALASILTVLVMSIERAIVIKYSIHAKNRFTNKLAWIIILLIWIVSLLSCLPPLFGKFNRYTLDPSKTSCTLDYLSSKENYKFYILVLSIFVWILPTIIITISYVIIIITFKKSSLSLKEIDSEQTTSVSKQQSSSDTTTIANQQQQVISSTASSPGVARTSGAMFARRQRNILRDSLRLNNRRIYSGCDGASQIVRGQNQQFITGTTTSDYDSRQITALNKAAIEARLLADLPSSVLSLTRRSSASVLDPSSAAAVVPKTTKTTSGSGAEEEEEEEEEEVKVEVEEEKMKQMMSVYVKWRTFKRVTSGSILPPNRQPTVSQTNFGTTTEEQVAQQPIQGQQNFDPNPRLTNALRRFKRFSRGSIKSCNATTLHNSRSRTLEDLHSSLGSILSKIPLNLRSNVAQNNHHAAAANSQLTRTVLQFRLAKMSFYLILLWLVSWTPIASLAMINSLTRCRLASATSVFMASTMTKLGPAFDVFIYGISHPKIKRKFKHLIRWLFMLSNDDSSLTSHQNHSFVGAQNHISQHQQQQTADNHPVLFGNKTTIRSHRSGSIETQMNI